MIQLCPARPCCRLPTFSSSCLQTTAQPFFARCPSLQPRLSGLCRPPTQSLQVVASRHRKKIALLGRPADQRKALIRTLTTQVLDKGKIRTTAVKAMAIRKYVDKMVGLAKDGSLHARRQALAFVYDPKLVASLFEGAQERYSDRTCGYCKVSKELFPRRGDNALMATIELL